MRSLTYESSDHSAQRATDDLDRAALLNQRTWIEAELALDERSNAFDLVLWNRCRSSFERNQGHDSGTRQNGQRLVVAEADKAISRKERPVDALLPILPAAPSGDRRKEGLNPLPVEMVSNSRLVPRPRPDREPLRAD
jgi:hypothetical protein